MVAGEAQTGERDGTAPRDVAGPGTGRPGAIRPATGAPGVVLAAPGGRGTGVRRIVAAALVGLGVLGVAYAVGAPLLSRRDYGTFAFWAAPRRVDYCGRRYEAGATLTTSATGIWSSYRDPSDRWTLTSRTFTGRPIYAVETDRLADGAVCAGTLYVPVGSGRWQTYPLGGGA